MRTPGAWPIMLFKRASVRSVDPSSTMTISELNSSIESTSASLSSSSGMTSSSLYTVHTTLSAYLAGDPLRFLVHAEKESLNDIVDVDKRPPLLAGAHDVNHPLLPGTQGHDVDGQVETHARRKAEHRGIAKDHGFEPGTCEISQFLLYAQLAFG